MVLCPKPFSPVAGDGEGVEKMAEGASIDVLLKSLINQRFFDCIDRKEITKNSELSHYSHLVKCNPNLENSWLMKPKPKKFESEEESIGVLPKKSKLACS